MTKYNVLVSAVALVAAAFYGATNFFEPSVDTEGLRGHRLLLQDPRTVVLKPNYAHLQNTAEVRKPLGQQSAEHFAAQVRQAETETVTEGSLSQQGLPTANGMATAASRTQHQGSMSQASSSSLPVQPQNLQLGSTPLMQQGQQEMASSSSLGVQQQFDPNISNRGGSQEGQQHQGSMSQASSSSLPVQSQNLQLGSSPMMQQGQQEMASSSSLGVQQQFDPNVSNRGGSQEGQPHQGSMSQASSSSLPVQQQNLQLGSSPMMQQGKQEMASSSNLGVQQQFDPNVSNRVGSQEGLQQSSEDAKKKKLEFIHITKSGGSAIEAAAAKHNIMWSACHYWKIPYLGCTTPDWEIPKKKRVERMPAGLIYQGEPWHSPPHWNDPNFMEDSDTFVVVRNPYERLVSEYYCSAFGYKGENREDPAVFNKWLAGNLTLLGEKLQGHMLPQHYYVYDEHGNRVVTHILRYENLQPEFDSLMEKYDLPVRMPTKSAKSVFHFRAKGKPNEEERITVNSISPENIQKVNEVYARDFEFFGYPMIEITPSMSVGGGGTLSPESDTAVDPINQLTVTSVPYDTSYTTVATNDHESKLRSGEINKGPHSRGRT